MANARASVVLPVKDGATHLSQLLEALAGQVFEGELEVLAIDSGSSDESLAILERHRVRTLRIPPGSFDHGTTRNLGAREARGETVVFLSQDAVPADSHVVARLAAALQGDRRLAGAFARQQPRPEADPLTRRDLAAWVAASPEPRTVVADDLARFEARPPLERYRLAAFDNVASAVRRTLLLEQPFAPTAFGEDVEWGLRMLRLGHGLAYVPSAVVVHSHARTARGLYRRNYLGHRLLYRLFGLVTIPDVRHLLRAVAGTVVGDLRELVRAGAPAAQLLAAPAQAVAAVHGQYRGARDEARRRPGPAWARP